jgi:uncharacterized protein (TIGR00251 family)
MLFIQDHPRGILITVLIQPKSSKNEIAGLHNDALKIRLTAPPVKGAANKMCLNFLAKCLNVPKSCLEIVSGHTSRTKRVLYRPKSNKSKEKQRNNLIHRFETLLNSKQTT